MPRPLFAAFLLVSSVHPAVAESAPLDRDALRHFYRVFSDTCYVAPTALQAETLVVAERIYQVTDGWPGGKDADIQHIAPDVIEHYAQLKQVYPTYAVEFTDEGIATRGDLPVLHLATGLPGLVLVDARNAASHDISVSALFAESSLPPSSAVSIARGRTMPILLPVTIDRVGIEEVTLTFTPVENGGPVGMLKVPAVVTPPSLLRGTAIDAATGEPFPSRVYVSGPDGIYRHARELAGNTTLTEKQVVFRPAMQRVPFSYTDGTFTVEVPAGEVTVTLERGYETPLVTQTVTLLPGGEGEITIGSMREFDMKARGWYSGDTHIHWAINAWNENEDIDLLAMVQRAEDLRVANNLTLYQWTSDAPFLKPDQAPMGPMIGYCDGDYHIQMAEEFRNDNHFGHINLLNIKELIVPVATGPGSGGPDDAVDYPTNKSIIDEARRQGGISIEAHNLGPFHASGVAVNVIQGYSDSLDQLEPRHYYNFLNAGVRIGLSNGSDHPARLAGICRVYVHAPGPLDYDKWCRRLAEGRTFTTSGPLLLLTVNDTDVGETLNLSPGADLRIKAEAWSRHPLGRVEIVSNGEVIAATKTEEQTATLEFQMPADEPRWFVARASRNDSFDALSGPGIAHTSAIYAQVDGKGVFKPEAAEVWIQNARQHRARLLEKGNFASDAQREEALAHVDAGIARYQELIDKHGE